jgi:RNA polymerase sigma-70 factor, ECF subfamily
MSRDTEFVDQLKQGRPAAFERLVEQFEAPLYRFFLCDHRNHHLAQEQSAETFAQLVTSLPRMRGGCEHLRAFVFATARHIQQRHWRTRQRTPAPPIGIFDLSDSRPSPLDMASDRDEVDRVLRAIAQLEDPVQHVMLLRFVEGCTLEEIANSLEMPLGTIKSHLHRGTRRLKQLFREKESDK